MHGLSKLIDAGFLVLRHESATHQFDFAGNTQCNAAEFNFVAGCTAELVAQLSRFGAIHVPTHHFQTVSYLHLAVHLMSDLGKLARAVVSDHPQQRQDYHAGR